MSMTVSDLIAELECLDPDIEVRIAQQPSWPFEYDISSRVYLRPKAKELLPEEELESMSDEERERYEFECENGKYADPTDPSQQDLFRPILYLVEGRQLGYLPGIVKDGVEW